MRRSYFGEDQDIVGTDTRPTADLGPLFATALPVHEATEAAIQAAHAHANTAWKQVAYAALVQVARTHERFTADSVWEALDRSTPMTHEPAAIGALFRIAAQKGLIVQTGELAPTKFKRRHRKLTVWRSLIVDRTP